MGWRARTHCGVLGFRLRDFRDSSDIRLSINIPIWLHYFCYQMKCKGLHIITYTYRDLLRGIFRIKVICNKLRELYLEGIFFKWKINILTNRRPRTKFFASHLTFSTFTDGSYIKRWAMACSFASSLKNSRFAVITSVEDLIQKHGNENTRKRTE